MTGEESVLTPQSISMILQKLGTFPHSVYIEECCKSMAEENEYPTDKYLLYIVRLQHIFEKMDHIPVQQPSEIIDSDTAAKLSVRTWRSDLESFKACLPFTIVESRM